MRDIVSPLDGFRSPFGSRRFAFTPASLFASGEEGAWYEPSDTTCFTDTAGTTPAGAGDTVARINDLSGNGNHATQTTPDSRPVLARVPEGGRRNLLPRSVISDFTAQNVSVTASQTDPLGGTDAYFISPSSGIARVYSDTITASDNDSASVSIKNSGWQWVALIFDFGAGGVGRGVWFDISNGVVGEETSAYTGAISVNADDPTFYDLSVSISSSGASRFRLYLVDSDGELTATASANGVIAYGPQFEEGSTATAYQKVVDQYDVTEAGVKSVSYVFDDEVDDALNWTASTDTDYTIARVDAGGTVTILTGQSLSGTTDILLEPDIAGYVAVDRALTSQETTDLTAYLEALA